MGIADEGFVQDYTLGERQELFIYCRYCRNTFPVEFKPKNDRIKLRCMCGHEAPLGELDVFSTKDGAEQHAAFYEQVYRAAKDALRDAGYPVPPSQRFTLEDLQAGRGSDIVPQGRNELEEESDIAASYQEGDSDSGVSPEALEVGLEALQARLRDAGDDVVARHEALTAAVEWTWCRRHFDDRVRDEFLAACQRDIELASEVVAAVKARRRAGEDVRLSFSSFKHLSLHYEEEGDLDAAALTSARAAELGLKGYQERADELRRRLEAGE